MGNKLLEQNAAELAQHLVELAAPVKNFLDDAEIRQTWEECTKKGVKNRLESVLTIYADMVPLLFGEKHLKDIVAILAAVEGKTVREMMEMNGVELMLDAREAWEGQLRPFFQRLGISVSGK